MKFLNKVLFYGLLFLLALLALSPIKAEIISDKSDKNHNLKENLDKCENSFQKIFPEKSLKKDEILKKEKDRNFAIVSKENEKKEKSNIKDEKSENNPRKLADEDNYIIVHYGNDASYPDGFRADGSYDDKITKIMYKGQTLAYNSPLTITAGTYIEIHMASSTYTLDSFFMLIMRQIVKI